MPRGGVTAWVGECEDDPRGAWGLGHPPAWLPWNAGRMQPLRQRMAHREIIGLLAFPWLAVQLLPERNIVRCDAVLHVVLPSSTLGLRVTNWGALSVRGLLLLLGTEGIVLAQHGLRHHPLQGQQQGALPHYRRDGVQNVALFFGDVQWGAPLV